MHLSLQQQLSRLHPSTLAIAGVFSAFTALMAEDAGIKALYLSGAFVANSCFALPDLGMTTVTEVAYEVERICSVTQLPLLVDADTGWGAPLMVERAVRLLESAGAAAVHIEDQQPMKRCGHREGKVLVSIDEMKERIYAARCGCSSDDFVIMARCDALESEGVEGAIKRCKAYVEAGAHMLFIEAAQKLEEYRLIKEATQVPLLANRTEFGKTAAWSLEQLSQAGVDMALFPLTAWRAMCHSAELIYKEIAKKGNADLFLPVMQTRNRLYELLNYDSYEKKADECLKKSKRER